MTKADVVAETFMAKSTLPEPTSSQQTDAPPHVQMAHFAVLRSRWAKKFLKQINPNEATGPDGIPRRLLKECATELAAIIVRIARRCISEGAWPRLWRYHWIQPLYKKKQRSLPSYYRGIHLTSIVSKTVERVIGKILTYFLHTSNAYGN